MKTNMVALSFVRFRFIFIPGSVVSGWEEREERGTMHVRRERREEDHAGLLVGQVDVRTPV